MRDFLKYDKASLFSKINKISIERKGDNVVTKFGNKIMKVATVSEKYEIFDIAKYLKDKINIIEKNFKINAYKFEVLNGKQYLNLISSRIRIGGLDFYKTFYILNSSDKTRKLSFNVGLYCPSSNFHIVSNIKDLEILKKHTKGVTQASQSISEIEVNTFDEQINSLIHLLGSKIKFSKLRDIILGDSATITGVNHKKFDAFKSSLRVFRNKLGLNEIHGRLLATPSEQINDIKPKQDFYLDSFWALQVYLKLFVTQDSHIIKIESEKIMKISEKAVRIQFRNNPN